MSEMKKEDLNFAMENFLKSLPPEMRESEALKESLRTSESFKAFASGGGSLASPDVAAWAQEPSSPGKRTPPHRSEGEQASPSPSELEAALRFKSNGNNCFKEGKFEKAIEAYGRGVKVLRPWQSSFQGGAPNRTLSVEERTAVVAMLSNKAACFLKLGQFESCAEDCKAVLKLSPKHVKALYRRSQSNRAMGRLKAAIKDLKKLLKIEPSNRVARASLEQIMQAHDASANAAAGTVSSESGRSAKVPGGAGPSGGHEDGAEIAAVPASASEGACFALKDLLADKSDLENISAALNSFTAELQNMLASVHGGVGNEFFRSALDEELLQLFEPSAGSDGGATGGNSAAVSNAALREIAAKTFNCLYNRLYALMDEEAPADGTPHFFGSDRLGLRAQCRALIKTSLTGNKHQLSKLRLFVSENTAIIDWLWVANSYRETCQRIIRGDTKGAYVHAFEAQVLRSCVVGTSSSMFEQLARKGGLGAFLQKIVQPKLKQFAVLAAIMEKAREEALAEANAEKDDSGIEIREL
jgi:tetratricopeptide (TPR) repeat protein